MGYQEGAAASSTEAPGEALPDFTIDQLRKQYVNFAGTKDAEIKEMRSARHYYHGDQWTEDAKKVLNKRKQPILTSNVIGRKIDGVVGLVERMRQDVRPIRARRNSRTARTRQPRPFATFAISTIFRP